MKSCINSKSVVLYNKGDEKELFKVKKIKTDEIVQVLDTYCDEYGKTWFLLWVGDKWGWRAADDFVPPNYIVKKKIIVAGSRTFNDYQLLKEILDKEKDQISEVVCGEAQGADSLGKLWATRNNIPVKSFLADWQQYGAAAGYIRNHQMGDYADKLIAFWDCQSKGTKDMMDYMDKLKKPVVVIRY